MKAKDLITFIKEKYSMEEEINNVLLVMNDIKGTHQLLEGDGTFIYTIAGKVQARILDKLP